MNMNLMFALMLLFVCLHQPMRKKNLDFLLLNAPLSSPANRCLVLSNLAHGGFIIAFPLKTAAAGNLVDYVGESLYKKY